MCFSVKHQKMVCYCVICNRRDSVHYFTFIHKMADVWYSSLQLTKPKFIPPNAYICSNHFPESDIETKGPEQRKHLMGMARPIFKTLREKEEAALVAERPKPPSAPVQLPTSSRVEGLEQKDGDEVMDPLFQVDPETGSFFVTPYLFEPTISDVEDDEDAIEGTQQHENRIKRMNRLLGLELGEERIEMSLGAGQPSWCSCGGCCVMGTPRENFCCREAIGSNQDFARNLAERVKQSPGPCITSNPAFQGICLHEQAILTTARAVAYATGSVLLEPMNRRLTRNKAYMAFSHWTHRKLGAGRRVEIPACVVSQIRREFPNEDGSNFEGFTSDNEL